MSHSNVRFLFLNLGHFLDHLFMLIFASVAVLRLTTEWNISYAELIPYATPGFIAFGVGAIAAGWVADLWSRQGMMVIFFIGIGISAILAGFSNTPLQMAGALLLVGLFAAIYHPVGLSMVVEGLGKTGVPLAINGVYGNMGVACAALFTGLAVDLGGWQTAFFVPGVVSVLIGLLYWRFILAPVPQPRDASTPVKKPTIAPAAAQAPVNLAAVFAVIFFTTAIGGFVFQSTTFALPKIFDERLGDLNLSATLLGWYTFLVFSLAALSQLLIGYLVDRYSIRHVFTLVAALQAVFFLVMIPLSGVAALIVAFAFMFVVFGQIPINDVLVGRMAKSAWRSRAYALRYLVTFSVMASTVPLIGWIHGNWGFDRLFMVLGCAAALICLATLCLPVLRPVKA